MTAIALALIASIGYGVSDFVGGLASRRVAALRVVIVSYPLSAVILILVAPFAGGVIPARPGLRRLVSGIDELDAQPLGKVSGAQRGGLTTGTRRRGPRLHPHLDAVGGPGPQRRGGTRGLSAARLGGTLCGRDTVVRVEGAPSAPFGLVPRSGADLDPAVQLGVGVIPDDADERERRDAPGRQATGAAAPPLVERFERKRAGAAGGLPLPPRRGVGVGGVGGEGSGGQQGQEQGGGTDDAEGGELCTHSRIMYIYGHICLRES